MELTSLEQSVILVSATTGLMSLLGIYYVGGVITDANTNVYIYDYIVYSKLPLTYIHNDRYKGV